MNDENVAPSVNNSETSMLRHQKMDGKALREWVKTELFKRVKFIYNPKKDLAVGGKIYQLFLYNCRDNLVGLETKEAKESKHFREMYVHRLWNDNKKNVTKEIANKRTAVYSTYHARFIDFGRRCIEKGIVIPLLEAFEKGIEIPKVHYIFQDSFVRSCVGEEAWKESVLTKDLDMRLCPVQEESMAMLFLKNYYFSWLLELKIEELEYPNNNAVGKMVTDYDTAAMLKDKRNITEVTLDYMQFNVDQNEEEDEEEEDKEQERLKKEYRHVFVEMSRSNQEDGGRQFKELGAASIKKMNEVRATVRNHSMYKKVMQLFKEIRDSEETDEAEIRSMKRKMNMTLRKYTSGGNERDGKYKGWSAEAADEMVRLSMQLKEKEGRKGTKEFNAAYRLLERWNLEGQGKHKRKREDTEVTVEYENHVWDLPDDLPVTEI